MNRYKKQMELRNESTKLRSLKFDTNKKNQVDKINEVQNEMYKRFQFYKKLNEALSRR